MFVLGHLEIRWQSLYSTIQNMHDDKMEKIINYNLSWGFEFKVRETLSLNLN